MPRNERELIRNRSPFFGQETRPDPAAQGLTSLGTQLLCLGSWAAAPILMHLAAVRQGGPGGQDQRVARAEFGQRRDRGATAAFQRAQQCALCCHAVAGVAVVQWG